MVLPSIFVAQPAMYRKSSAANGTSAARATARGLPLSRVSSSANSSKCSVMRSPILQMIRPRSDGVMRLHGPSSKARRAARTARSMSTASPSATSASISPVAGLMVSKVLPDTASTICPSMNSCWRVPMKSWTCLSRVGAVMGTSPWCPNSRTSDARRPGVCSTCATPASHCAPGASVASSIVHLSTDQFHRSCDIPILDGDDLEGTALVAGAAGSVAWLSRRAESRPSPALVPGSPPG